MGFILHEVSYLLVVESGHAKFSAAVVQTGVVDLCASKCSQNREDSGTRLNHTRPRKLDAHLASTRSENSFALCQTPAFSLHRLRSSGTIRYDATSLNIFSPYYLAWIASQGIFQRMKKNQKSISISMVRRTQ